jgi:hypothetical protein
MPQFIPRSDDQCLAWSANYVRRINANPAKYRISEEDAAHLARLQAEFAERLYLVRQPHTRNAMRIGEKNATRRQMVRVARRVLNTARAAA